MAVKLFLKGRVDIYPAGTEVEVMNYGIQSTQYKGKWNYYKIVGLEDWVFTPNTNIEYKEV